MLCNFRIFFEIFFNFNSFSHIIILINEVMIAIEDDVLKTQPSQLEEILKRVVVAEAKIALFHTRFQRTCAFSTIE
jgi:hypothetical protein